MLNTTPSRTQPRVPIDVEVSALDGEQRCLARARDLSVGGLYLDTPAGSVLDHVAQVSLTFVLPGDVEPVWALCEVIRDDRRRQVDGHALAFSRMASADRRRVERYVRDYFAPVARPLPKQKGARDSHRQPRDLFRFRSVGDLLG